MRNGSRKARGRLYRLRRREDRARPWSGLWTFFDGSESRAKSIVGFFFHIISLGRLKQETCLRPRKPVFLAPSPHSPSRDTSVEPSTLERHPLLGRLDHHDPDRARARARSVLARRRALYRVFFPRLFPARARARLVRARLGDGRGRRHPGARERRRFRSTRGRSRAPAVVRFRHRRGPARGPIRQAPRRSASGGGAQHRPHLGRGHARAPGFERDGPVSHARGARLLRPRARRDAGAPATGPPVQPPPRDLLPAGAPRKEKAREPARADWRAPGTTRLPPPPSPRSPRT